MVVVAILASYTINLAQACLLSFGSPSCTHPCQYGIRIVGHIDPGLPAAAVPPLWLLGALIQDGFIIALVAYLEIVSICKMWAEKVCGCVIREEGGD
jgi:MFS superfamily sulfate permease-like transporter